MKEVTIIQCDKADLQDIVRQELEEAFYARFAGNTITTEVVAGLLNITPETVTSYVRRGELKPIRPHSSKYSYRLSDVLRMMRKTQNN